jgi:putative inorganic carbon (hco3(-)) transporter
MRDIVVLLVILLGFVLALSSRFNSVLFYWWLAVFRPQDWMWMDISSLRISLLAGLIVVVGAVMARVAPLVGSSITRIMLAFLGLEILASVLNGCDVSWKHIDQMFRAFLVLFITNRLIKTPRDLLVVMFIMGISLSFFASKAGFFSLLQGGASQYGASNLRGSFVDSNGFAHGTAVLMFFVLVCAFNARLLASFFRRADTPIGPGLDRMWRWGLIAVVLLSAFNVMSLSSRGSSLAMFLGGVIFIAFRPNGIARMVKLTPVVLAVALLVPLPEGFEERIGSVFVEEEELDSSASSRLFLWGAAIDMAAKYPLGVGAKCFAPYLRTVRPQGYEGVFYKTVHSTHFQVLAEMGYFGAVLWVLLSVIVFGKLLRVRARAKYLNLSAENRIFLETTSSGLVCAMVVFLVGGAFYNHFFIETVWFTVVLTEALSRISKQLLATAQETQPETLVGEPQPSSVYLKRR